MQTNVWTVPYWQVRDKTGHGLKGKKICRSTSEVARSVATGQHSAKGELQVQRNTNQATQKHGYVFVKRAVERGKEV